MVKDLHGKTYRMNRHDTNSKPFNILYRSTVVYVRFS